jgi:hypothetical protein
MEPADLPTGSPGRRHRLNDLDVQDHEMPISAVR